MTDDERIAALLEHAGLDGAEAGAALGGGTSAHVRRIDCDGRPVAVAKLADPQLPSRRVDAEAHVLGVIGPRSGLPIPPLLARVEDDLLVGWAGASGPAGGGGGGAGERVTVHAPVPDVLAALSRVHATRLERADDHRLARWGRGTGGAAVPFARRSRRVARRASGFLALLPAERRDPWERWLVRVVEGFERSCQRVADLPAGLVHGDLHPGHAIPVPGGVILVDWQHASVGPTAVDVVRVLVEHAAAAGQATVAADRLEDEIGPESLDDVLLLTIGGLVAGFGARRPHELAPWERAIVDRATDPAGWAANRLGHVAGGTDRVGTTPRSPSMSDPTRDALDTIRRSVEQAVAAGEDVRRATETAVRQAGDRIEAGGERFNRAAESAFEGAMAGARRAGGDADGPLKDVLDGLGDAVGSAANATKLAMEEAAGSGRRFAEEDLRRARDEMRTLSELFGRTLTDALEQTTGRSRDAIADLERHAERVAERVGPSLKQAMDAAAADPLTLARQSAEASVKATGAVVSSVFETMGRMLEETGRAMGGTRGGSGAGSGPDATSSEDRPPAE